MVRVIRITHDEFLSILENILLAVTKGANDISRDYMISLSVELAFASQYRWGNFVQFLAAVDRMAESYAHSPQNCLAWV